MNGREWVDGDVAMVNGDVCMRVCGKWDHGQDNRFAYGRDDDRNARPLVVIDPEEIPHLNDFYDGNPCAALNIIADDVRDIGQGDLDATEQIIRWLAERMPTDPKPAEPTGLGAVVEDAKGDRWVRLDRQVTPWVDGQSFPQRWRDLDIVRIVSEGVTL